MAVISARECYMDELTERQQRELEYHRKHASLVAEKFRSVNYDVVTSATRWWWNAYWDIWTFLIGQQLAGKKVLIAGCGWGGDALRFAKLGAVVSACDLSSDMMALGIKLAKDSDLNVSFAQMPCEKMTYEADTFDVIFCRDILHHVDIHATMKEITRVAKPGALLVADEIYSHSILDRIRHSWVVERFVYPMVRKWIYKGKILYITEDERKMTEDDIDLVKSYIEILLFIKYFNFISTRIVSENVECIAKADRVCLYLLGPLGRYLGGRATFAGYLPDRKS